MARRRNAGEGSIFERADGRWCAQLDLGWENGKRRRKCVYGATAQEVQDALLKARADLAAGLPVAVEKQTVGQFLDRWLEAIRSSVRPRISELRDSCEAAYRAGIGPLEARQASAAARSSRASAQVRVRAVGADRPPHPRYPAHRVESGNQVGVGRTQRRVLGHGAEA